MYETSINSKATGRVQLPAELKHSSRSKLAALRERAPQAESLNANTRKGGHHTLCTSYSAAGGKAQCSALPHMHVVL